MNRSRRTLVLAAVAACFANAEVGGQSTFEDVAPVLDAKCVSCHGVDVAEAGLSLDSWESLFSGSDHGEAVIAFDPDHSLALEIASAAEGPHPSELSAEALTQAEIDRLVEWVRDGARSGDGRVPFAEMESPLYSANQDASIVSVIDTEAHVVARHVHLDELGFGLNAKPHHVAVEPDGSFWYLSLIGANRVLKLDRDNQLVGQAEFEVPGMLALHPTANDLFVGRSMSAVDPPRRIGRIDRSEMIVEEIDIFFPRPHALAVAPDGGRVYSASLGTNQIAAVDPESEALELIGLDGAQHAPVQFAIDPTGELMMAATQLTGLILVFDLLDPDQPYLRSSVRVGPAPWHPAYSPDGSRVYVGNKMANTVTVLDGRTAQVLRVIRHPGISQPHGSAVRPDGRYVYISSNNVRGTYRARHGATETPVGTVAVIEAATGTVVKVLEVESNATGLGIRAGQ